MLDRLREGNSMTKERSYRRNAKNWQGQVKRWVGDVVVLVLVLGVGAGGM